jgi:hypothetical protein
VQPFGYLIVPERDHDFPFTEWVTGIIIANPYRQPADRGARRPVPEGLRCWNTAST